MSTRESISVNSRTLTYTGLIDFGEGEMQSSHLSDKANHALVFMFQPLADEYTQCIGVFAPRAYTRHYHSKFGDKGYIIAGKNWGQGSWHRK